jgi:hypothetical protein
MKEQKNIASLHGKNIISNTKALDAQNSITLYSKSFNLYRTYRFDQIYR